MYVEAKLIASNLPIPDRSVHHFSRQSPAICFVAFLSTVWRFAKGKPGQKYKSI